MKAVARSQDLHPGFTDRQIAVLAAITLLAAVLRLAGIGEWSLWVDEAHTVRDAVSPSEAFWQTELGYYPLSYLILRGLFELGMPATEGWLRLPFVFFGILSVPALGLLGRILVGRHAALVAALLLAVSPWHIYWSQNARSYAIVLFFALLAAGGFYDGMLRRSPVRLFAALGLAVLAGLCHPSAYILIGGLLVYTLFAGRADAEPRSTLWKWGPALILLLLSALAAVLLPALEHAARAKPDFSLFHLLQTLVFFVRVPLLVAALGGLALLFDRGDRVAAFLLCWALVPVLALAVLGAGVTKVTAQYAFYTLPAFCLLGGVITCEIAARVQGTGFRGALLRVVPFGILLLDMGGHTWLYLNKYHGERPRWRDAAAYVQERAMGRLRVLTTNGPSLTYYLDPRAMQPGPSDSDVVALADYMIEESGGGKEFMAREVAAARSNGADLWIVLTEPELDEMDPGGLMDAYVRTHFAQVRRYPNWTGPKDMTVLVYHLLPLPPG